MDEAISTTLESGTLQGRKEGVIDAIADISDQATEPVVIIEPTRGRIGLNLKDLWEYRELLYFLTWRDIKVRYKQTALGAAWAIIQPFFSMVVFHSSTALD